MLASRFVSCWPLGVHFWGHSGSVGFNVRIAACVPRCGTEWSEKNRMRVARPVSERSLPAARPTAPALPAPLVAVVGCDGASQPLRLPWPLPQAFWLIYIDTVFGASTTGLPALAKHWHLLDYFLCHSLL